MSPRRVSLSAQRGRTLLIVLAVVIAAALAGGAWLLLPRFESAPPTVVIAPAGETVGQAAVQVQASDAGTGLKSVAVTLLQGGAEIKLVADNFAQVQRDASYSLVLARVAGVKEGPAVLRVAARDRSLWRGNETVVEKKITLDFTPPSLSLKADDRYVNFGGVGVLTYTTSPDTVKSGVQFGTRFFPGFAGQVAGQPDTWIVLFAHAYDVPAEARPTLIAVDAAGNTREMAVAYELKNVSYRKSTIALSEPFLRNRVAPLLADAAARDGAPRDVFVAVNKGLRKQNEQKIAEVTTAVTSRRLWEGAFAQLSNSKVEANFADERTYTWNGEPIDTALHLGYDLSVTKAYPVEAANAGNVVFAGDLGIYGGTVIIDHGLGLFTLYSHLSAIDAKVGDALARKQILGKTGETGLAAGDHLHYGVYVSGVAVLPIEWWDPKWMKDNLTPKLEGRARQEAAPASTAKKPAAKAARKSAAKKKRS
jgi:murein DD-endopeptidase MepM/ murein hydrolase activator NlpD